MTSTFAASGSCASGPLGAAGLNPVARIGEQLMVSFLPPGSITVLNYGYLVISAVGGTVFFRSVIVALVPRLTDAHNHGGQAEVRRFTGLGDAIMLAISLPLDRIHGGARAGLPRSLSSNVAVSSWPQPNCSARCWPCTR